MDIVDQIIYLKKPWLRQVFTVGIINLSQHPRIESTLIQYVITTLKDFQLSLYFQSKHDVLINYVVKYYQYLFSELTTLEDDTFLDKIASYAQKACYLYWVSITLNEDFEVDFYFFIDQLHPYPIEEIEDLYKSDYHALKQAYKQLDYLPLLLNHNPMLAIPTDEDGQLIISDQVLEEMSSDAMIREVFDNLEENIKYLRQQSQDAVIAEYEAMVTASQKDIASLQIASSTTTSSASLTRRSSNLMNISSSSIRIDAKLLAETIASLEKEVQLVMDQTSDLELDQLLQALTADQVKSCDEINTWSQGMRGTVAEYFKNMVARGNSVLSSHMISRITQEMEISSIEFEAKLQQTMEKKAELDQLIEAKMLMLNDMQGQESSVDAMVMWLREISAEKFSTSEKVSNLLSSIYSNMISSYILENRQRKILRNRFI